MHTQDDSMADSSPQRATTPDERQTLEAMIARATDCLPQQGPIGVFVAQNPLQSLESMPFREAAVVASRLLEAEPYLPEERYRAELAAGRITPGDIDAVLDDEHRDVPSLGLCHGRLTLRELHRTLLLHNLVRESDAGARWALTETGAIETLRGDLDPQVRWKILTESLGEEAAVERATRLVSHADEQARSAVLSQMTPLGQLDDEREVSADLWHACLESLSMTRPTLMPVTPPVRFRDLIVALEPRLDTDAMVHPFLIRWCAAFLDQGVAAWPMPGRDLGLLQAVVGLSAPGNWESEAWASRLGGALDACRGRPSIDVIQDELVRLGIPPQRREEFLTRSLLALRGWAGMIQSLEARPDRAPVLEVPARVVDFLALRLVCDRVAVSWAAGKLGVPVDDGGVPRQGFAAWWVELQDRFPWVHGQGALARSLLLHQVAQLVGMTPADIRELTDNELLQLEGEIRNFDPLTRRRLLHAAYERRYRTEVLDALEVHAASTGWHSEVRPWLQVVLCMDERCESFRRHLEELGPDLETFGTAGFFAVPMSFRGIDDWHASPLCPIVVRPRHTVEEVPDDGARHLHDLHRAVTRRLGRVKEGISSGSRTLLGGSLVAMVAGALAAVPLVARVVFPRLADRLYRRAQSYARRHVPTRLLLERTDDNPLPDGTLAGFDIAEMAGCVRRVLEDIGLRTGFARIVAILGHGSSSRNNPHESAYHCGACGGGPGGPNARAFALMANDPRVRALLAAEGLSIPADTWFIGGMLDTCSNTVVWYDTAIAPTSHTADLSRLELACEHACGADAQERCRRFDSAPPTPTPAAARAHVEGRSVDLAQVRPELGHATNAVCIVGRRRRTRGLYLDRRAFLVSYDPDTDPDGEILTRTLAAVGPVASGINLAYYFSTVDRLRFGCNTKLPHNIAGLVGVMDGHASDLRTGLPWQTVEIHEPMRLLLVIDAPVERILASADRLPGVKQLFTNGWVQLAVWKESGALEVFDGRTFRPHARERSHLPIVDRSISWFQGKHGHVPPAQILSAATSARRR
jgi:uncharacterized protein YbcC (UPF0753/DUF2309 family)